jgi:hypothetical protein
VVVLVYLEAEIREIGHLSAMLEDSTVGCAASQTSANAALTVVRGESKTFLMVVQDSKKVPVDITGAKIWFSVKNRIEDVALIIGKRNLAASGVDGQILITLPQTGASIGQATIFIVPADTAALDPCESYICDVWLQTLTGEKYQIVKNRKFIIDPAVTTQFL